MMLSSHEILENKPTLMMGTSLDARFAPPCFNILTNALSIPFIKRNAPRWWLAMEKGIFTADREHVVSLSDMRQNRKIYWPDDGVNLMLSEGSFKRIEGDLIYGGTVYEQFGHIITDSISRLYPYLVDDRYDKFPILFHCKSMNAWRSFICSDICLSLGLNNRNLILADSALSIERLHYSEALFQDGIFASKFLHEYMAKIRRVGEVSVSRSSSVAYISRTRLTGGTNVVVNEKMVEDLARSLGFDIFYPEELSIESQVSIYSRYNRICGFPSSFFHMKLFAKDPCKIIFLVPDAEDALHINFLNIDVSSSFRDKFVVIPATITNEKDGFARARCVDEQSARNIIYQISRMD